jgi:hypothetical protein
MKAKQSSTEHLEHVQHLMDHAERAAVSHAEMAATHRKISKAHHALAKATEDQTVAQAHRDIAAHHGLIGDEHESRGRDYSALAEHLAGAGEADQIDSHDDGGDSAKTAHRAEFAKRVLDFAEIIGE